MHAQILLLAWSQLQFKFMGSIYHVLNVQENGHSTMYSWVLSTGWWESRAPINSDAVVIVGFLCTCLIGGFFHINRYFPWFHPKLCLNFTRHSYSSWYNHITDSFGVKSEALEVQKKTIISINDTYTDHSKPILLMVCKPNILGKSSSAGSWWRGWSWSSCIFSYLFFSPPRFVHHVHVPKKSWHGSISPLTIFTIINMIIEHYTFDILI